MEWSNPAGGSLPASFDLQVGGREEKQIFEEKAERRLSPLKREGGRRKAGAIHVTPGLALHPQAQFLGGFGRCAWSMNSKRPGRYFYNDSDGFAPPHPDVLGTRKTGDIVSLIETIADWLCLAVKAGPRSIRPR